MAACDAPLRQTTPCSTPWPPKAGSIASMWQALPIRSSISTGTRRARPPPAFGQHLEQVAASLKDALCGPAAQAKGLHLDGYMERLWRELGTRMPLIEEREREGFVRRCHGDLHLKNLVLWEGRPRLFDAIEFDEGCATIDVLYDLAFLLMDLWHRGLRHEANTILNHYLERAAISELMGLALLPLFMSVRAAIRAMTGLHALGFQDAATQERSLAGDRELRRPGGRAFEARPAGPGGNWRDFGDWQDHRARERAAPFIGAAPGALHLRTDVERKVMQGVAFGEALPQEAYGMGARDEVYRRVFKKAEVALDAGHSAIVDAVFPEEAGRAALRELAQGAGVEFWGFWLEADAAVIRERIAARNAGAADASDAGYRGGRGADEERGAPAGLDQNRRIRNAGERRRRGCREVAWTDFNRTVHFGHSR